MEHNIKKIKINNKIFELEIADTFISRTIGLLKYKQIPPNKALIISPCNSIHTFFMRFSISVVFIDKNNKVVEYKKNIKPWRVKFSLFNSTRRVIEIAYTGNEKLVINKNDLIELL